MQNVRAQLVVPTLIFALSPVFAIADSGEALLGAILLGTLSYLNFFWPIVLPMFFLNTARKKFSSYVYSVIVCGLLSWLLTYFPPRQLVPWLFPEFTLTTLGIVVLYVILASVLAIVVSVRVVPRIRDFNDAHD